MLDATIGIAIWKVTFAMILGGLIGIEREFADKPAGLRTHIMVAGASALLVVLGDAMIIHYGNTDLAKVVSPDPIRIMEAIVTGISFLGAGTIIFKNQEGSIEGLTTAASILYAAAIGIGVALSQYWLSGLLTIIAIVILVGLGFLEGFIKRLRKRLLDDSDN